MCFLCPSPECNSCIMRTRHPNPEYRNEFRQSYYRESRGHICKQEYIVTNINLLITRNNLTTPKPSFRSGHLALLLRAASSEQDFVTLCVRWIALSSEECLNAKRRVVTRPNPPPHMSPFLSNLSVEYELQLERIYIHLSLSLLYTFCPPS
jgi:hypothetical protein